MPEHPLTFPSLIVSCQARDDNPLHGPHFMAAMAEAAVQGGAGGIRANGPDDVRAIRERVSLPIIGLYKRVLPGSEVYITPTLKEARAVAEAGADVIALDATLRPRPGLSAAGLIQAVREELGRSVLADIATLEEGVAAAQAGADYVATTLSGYTAEAPMMEGPDFALLEALAKALDRPVVAEGRFWTPQDVERAFALGAAAVVVGTAITNPREITKRFAAGVLR